MRDREGRHTSVLLKICLFLVRGVTLHRQIKTTKKYDCNNFTNSSHRNNNRIRGDDEG